MDYEGIAKREGVSPFHKKKHREVLGIVDRKKGRQRAEINKNVGDLEDNHADTAKWASFLTTIVAMLWDVQSEDQKALLPADKREMIDYTLEKFKITDTRADVQFSKEGIGMVDKLIARQAQIGEIVGKDYV